MTTVRELWAAAPYPDDKQQRGPAELARHLTLLAYRQSLTLPRSHQEWYDAGLPPIGPLRDAYVNTCSAISAQFGLIVYLRRAAGLPCPDTADAYLPYDGHMEDVEELLTDWLGEYGIDVETEIRRNQQEEAADRPAADLRRVLADVADDQQRGTPWLGQQSFPDGIPGQAHEDTAEKARAVVAMGAALDQLTWREQVDLRVATAYAADSPDVLRDRLLALTGTVACWIQDLDRRQAQS